jgi:hypothetical protein
MASNDDKYLYSKGTHYIANSGSDENKAYKGGQAGDQTGHEAELKKWYNRPWSVVLRYPVQAVALEIAKLSIAMCLNDRVGYDQGQRGTYWTALKAAGYDPSKVALSEQDCTSGVSADVKAAGHICGIPALENLPLCSSRNMRAEFVKAGFIALTDKKYLNGPNDLLPGDILLYENHHAACNITLGKNVREQWNPDYSPTPDIEPEPPEDDPDAAPAEDDDDMPAVVITGTVNVRKGPGVEYERVTIAHKGDRLPWLGWYPVIVDGQVAWVSGKYAEPEK